MAIGYTPALPLSIDSEDGAYALIKNSRELVQQNFKMLLLTAPGERMMEPRYGVGLRRYLFEPDVLELRQEIRKSIEEQAEIYMPYLQIDNMMMFSSDQITDMSTNAMQLRITYSVPSIREKAFIDLSLSVGDSNTI
mgnify:FL=1